MGRLDRTTSCAAKTLHGRVTRRAWQRRNPRCRTFRMTNCRTLLRLFALASLALAASSALAAECARPTPLRFEVQGKIVRSQVGFTQGLEWRDGKLFESTGAIGGHS